MNGRADRHLAGWLWWRDMQRIASTNALPDMTLSDSKDGHGLLRRQGLGNQRRSRSSRGTNCGAFTTRPRLDDLSNSSTEGTRAVHGSLKHKLITPKSLLDHSSNQSPTSSKDDTGLQPIRTCIEQRRGMLSSSWVKNGEAGIALPPVQGAAEADLSSCTVTSC